MPIHVSWGNQQKTYTFFRFENKWTWDEYHRAIDEARDLTRDCDYKVNVLVDFTECHLFPQNLLSNVRSSVIQYGQATDIVIIVTTSRFVEMLLSTLEKIAGKQWMNALVVRTVDEGRLVLAEHDRLYPVSSPVPAAGSESVPAPAEPTSPRQ